MFQAKSSYDYDELIACANGELFGPGNPRLPLPPMLMFDRISEISSTGGKYENGYVVAEMAIRPDLWFFECHFREDPVMPGCLGLDALWQLVGFYLGWNGGNGKGRALGVGSVKFTDQVLIDAKSIEYRLDLKRVMTRRLTLGIADGEMKIDGRPAYKCEDLKVGLFIESSAEKEST